MPVSRSVSILALTLALGAAPVSTRSALAQEPASSAAPVFSDQQRQAIESIVKEYLIKNPDVLQEAIA